MTGIPTWMTGTTICISKTFNGYCITQNPSDIAPQSVSFSTWADLDYYLQANFAPAASPAPAP